MYPVKTETEEIVMKEIKARKLPSGSYNTVVNYYDETGRRKQKSFTAKAEAKAVKMAQDFLDGFENEYDDTITLKKAIEIYIETREHTIQPTTVRIYRQYLKNRYKLIQNKRLCDLKPIDIQKAVNIESGRISPKYVHTSYGFLKSVLTMFEVDINLKSIKLPKVVRKENELPDFDTVFGIVKGDEIELPVLLASWMSLRIGEVCGLQFRDVDEDKKLLNVRRTVILTENGNKVRESCKTEKSTRTLQLPDYILNLIKAVPHENDTDQIIQLTPKALRSRFKRRVVKKGYDITFHDLRHLNASVMLMLGVPDKYAMERGGWSTDNILKSVYQQTFSAERIKVDARIDDYFNGIVNNA